MRQLRARGGTPIPSHHLINDDECTINGCAQELESQWVALGAAIEGLRGERAEAAAAVAAAEREALVWERRVQLEREAQASSAVELVVTCACVGGRVAAGHPLAPTTPPAHL